MPKRQRQIKINSILGGQSALSHLSGKDQFQTSLAIDPDLPIDPTVTAGTLQRKTSGMLNPSMYATFDGAPLSGAPMWAITTPKTPNGTEGGAHYFYTTDGELISYDAGFASETVEGTATSGNGSGAAYYNNYIYMSTPTEISRFGPLGSGDGGASMANTWWNGTTGLTLLTDTTYPTYNSVEYPNHPMHVHTDNKLYFGDYINGQGLIHFIKTKKTTYEGDTNDGSAYNALDLPFGFAPTDIESYGNKLVVAGVFSTDTAAGAQVKQGEAALFVWDTIADSFDDLIKIPMPFVSALKNVNGILYAFGGTYNSGMSIYAYTGGKSVQLLNFFDEGQAPFAGAVDNYENRLVWGQTISYPETQAVVMSRGYKHPGLNQQAINNIMVTSATGSISTKAVTCVKNMQQASGMVPRYVVGWRDGTNNGIEKYNSNGTQFSVWRSQMYNVGRPFRIIEIRIPLSTAVAANMLITPSIMVDNESTTFTLDGIDTGRYANSERVAIYKIGELTQNASGAVRGEQNFELNLNWAGTAYLGVQLPIEIIIEVEED